MTRRWKITLILISAIALLIGVLLALATRAPVIANLLQSQFSGVRITGAAGSPLGTMRIARIDYETDTLQVTVEDVLVVNDPWPLFSRTVQVEALRAERVVIRQKRSSDGPAKAPQSLALPFPLRVKEMTVGRIVLHRTAGEPIEVRDLLLSGEADASRLSLTRIEATGPDTTLRGQLRLGAVAPFNLSGDLSLTATAARHQWAAQVKAGGTLLAMDLNANIRTTEKALATRFDAKTRIELFALRPIAALEADVHDLDLRQWRATLPHSRIAGNVSLKPQGNDLAGTARFTNDSPGAIDVERVPVNALRSALLLQPDGQVILSGLEATAGRSTMVRGGGRWQGNQLDLNLLWSTLDLRDIHSALIRTTLQGRTDLKLGEKEQSAVVALADAQLSASGNVRIAAGKAEGDVTLSGTRLGKAAGSFQAMLDGNRSFSASGKVEQVNLAALGRLPVSRINGEFQADGALHPQRKLQLRLNLPDGSLADRPFVAKADVEVTGDVMERAAITANLAGNRLEANGGFGRTDLRLQWTLDAPNLATLGSSFGGKAKAGGVLSGTLNKPTLEAQASMTQLKLPGDIVIVEGDVNTKISLDRDAPAKLTANIRKLTQAGRELITEAKADLSGTGASHRLQLAARNTKWTIDSTLSGATGGSLSWAGEIGTLTAKGPLDIRLLKPAPLLLAQERQRLGNALLSVSNGELNIDSLDRTGTTLDSRGTLSKLPVAALLPLLDPALRDTFDTTLRLKGGWDINWVDTPTVRANIQREDGDLVLRTDPPFAYGLDTLNLTARTAGNNLNMQLDVKGSGFGQFTAAAQLPFSATSDDIQLSRTQSVTGKVDANLPALRWVGPWIGHNHDMDGQLTAALTLGGTWPRIRPSGRFSIANIRYAHLAEGIAFKDGLLDALLDGDRITLQRFQVKAGEGSLSAKGAIQLDEADARAGIEWSADKLHLLNLLDRSIIASGSGKVEMKSRQLAISGNLRADSGRILLADTAAASLSSDVIVIGRDTPAAGKSAPRPLQLDLKLNLGNDFRLAGRGLDARLAGELHIASAPGNPLRTTGTLRARSGTYKAYGQELAIDRAIVSFNGPIDNPSLDILALRKGLSVEPGVMITGTAERPVVRLTSTPDLPDGEKLSWLVLGRGSDGMGDADRGAMQAAARTLLAQGAAASLAGSLAGVLGVDEIGLGRSSASNADPAATDNTMVVTVGKRLSSRASILYEQGLNGANSLIKLSYQLSRRWRVQLVTGSENAVDFFFRLAFD